MSKHDGPDGEQPDLIEIFFELPPLTREHVSVRARGRHDRAPRRERAWAFDENGEADIVLFVSPRWLGYGRKTK
jgi:hypothetical protein